MFVKKIIHELTDEVWVLLNVEARELRQPRDGGRDVA